MSWGTPEEIERRSRIRLSIAAYAYESLNESIMPDGDYDKLALEINVKQKTGNKKLDSFFTKEYDPNTGVWIRKHPDLQGIHHLYERHYSGKV